MSDTRKLLTSELQIGNYSSASMIYSYGDVLDFVDGRKQGIVIVDTPGHVEEVGQQMLQFLRTEIANGWGVSGDALEELLKLGQKLAELHKGTKYCEHWADYSSASYTQIDGDRITLSMGGGLGETLIVRADRVERILMKGGTIDGPFLDHYDPVYTTTLQTGETMLLCTDGFVGNMRKTREKESKRQNIAYATTVAELNTNIEQIIRDNSLNTAQETRDALIAQLGTYFLPRTERDDDVTIVVVKRG
jgi:hypothetical protein